MGHMIRSTMLLGLLTGLFLFIGYALAGQSGMVIALIIAGIMNFLSYWFSDRIVLAMYRAREISYEEAPWLHQMVEELARKANIPKPGIYLVPMEQPNAFATGRGPGHAAVAVTRGIMEILDEEELKGVLAHELGHIINRDVLISTIAATIAGAISMIVHWLQWALIFGFGRDEEDSGPGALIGSILLIIITPIIATLIQLAISRSREYLADETGAKLCGCPLALARALEKIHNYVMQVPPSQVNEGTAHLFIDNPLKGGLMELLSTHPPMEKRVARLVEMARKMEQVA